MILTLEFNFKEKEEKAAYDRIMEIAMTALKQANIRMRHEICMRDSCLHAKKEHGINGCKTCICRNFKP